MRCIEIMFKTLREAIEDGKEEGKRRGEEKKQRAKERFKEEMSDERAEERATRKELLLSGEGISGMRQQRDSRIRRMGRLYEDFREYLSRDSNEPEPDRRFEYETDEIEYALIPYVGEYLDYRAKDGWKLVRTYTRDDLGVEPAVDILDDKLYMVFERPVDD